MAINDLQIYRQWILKGEVCSLLHDLRKLSREFIEYRQWWHAQVGGWGEDPHEKPFSTSPEPLSGFAALLGEFKTMIALPRPRGSDSLSPDSMIERHVTPQCGVYEYALKAGDSLDAAQDRNNPLWSAEQTDRTIQDKAAVLASPGFGRYFRSNVFGFEDAANELHAACLEQQRKGLLTLLQAGLFRRCWLEQALAAEDREDLLRTLQAAFEPACSDTTRPGNDTSLWEHTYAVASLTKALQAHYVIYDGSEPKTYFGELPAPFQLWGVGWDAVRFIGRGQRLHDHGARRALMARVRASCRRSVEYCELLGNCVYEDDGTLIFLLPAFEKGREQTANYKARLDEAADSLRGYFEEESGGELWPHFLAAGPTRDTTGVAGLLGELHSAKLAPAAVSGKRARALAQTLDKDFTPPAGKAAADVCPICGLRPAREDVEVGRICETCFDRRVTYAQDARKSGNAQTNLIAEIADAHGRCALIVGRFGLKDWLNGQYVRSLFVSEARGLDAEIAGLGLAKDTAAEETALKAALARAGNYDYDRIVQEVKTCYELQREPGRSDEARRAEAEDFYFLYTQRARGKTGSVKLNRYPSDTPPAYCWQATTCFDELANRVNAKTPTPSTLLDVWETTQEFTSAACGEMLLSKQLPQRSRAVFSAAVKGGFDPKPFEIYRGTLGRRAAEFYFDDGKREVRLVGEHDAAVAGATITDLRSDAGPRPGSVTLTKRLPDEQFSPFREVIATPQMFMALVPAAQAVEVAVAITREAQLRFGKVWGRLPFSLGVLLFDQHHPMFLVLDGGRRLLRRFQQRDNDKETLTVERVAVAGSRAKLQLKDAAANAIEWDLDVSLGTGKPDYYHPYCVVPEADRNRKSFFWTPADNVVHFTDLQAGDNVQAAASKFSFYYLNSSASRFELEGEATPTVRLELLEQGIEKTWKILWDTMTDAGVRGLCARLDTKLRDWGVGLPIGATADAAQTEWLKLAAVEIARSPIPLQHHDFLLRQLRTGLFFHAVRLHLQGLRDRLRQDDPAQTAGVTP